MEIYRKHIKFYIIFSLLIRILIYYSNMACHFVEVYTDKSKNTLTHHNYIVKHLLTCPLNISCFIIFYF